MFEETKNGCVTSNPFVYKINPFLYKVLTLILIENKNFFKELKKVISDTDINEHKNAFNSLPSELKNHFENKAESFKSIKDYFFYLTHYEQFFKELGAGLKFSPLSGKKSTNQFLKNTYTLLEEFTDKIKPKLIYKKVKASVNKNDIELTDYKTILQSKKLSSYFYNPGSSKSEVILYIVTIGEEIDNLIEKFLSKDEIVDAYTLNAIGGAAAEMIAYDFNLYANENFLSNNDNKYKRFSPGYGDLSLSVQKILFDILKPQKTIGVKLSEENIIVPEKSTSGIMGLVEAIKE